MKKDIKHILSARRHISIRDMDMSPSAVLVLLLRRERDVAVLLTLRSAMVPHHKGEISFPGGRWNPDDTDLLQTALREVEEEIGVRPENVDILGRLDDVCTVSTKFIVSPYVGMISYPYPFQINHKEIAELFIVPLNLLRAQYEDRIDKGKAEEVRSVLQDASAAFSFHYEGRVIWGATARILCQFLGLTHGVGGLRNG